jgi:putative aldouronate transport system substrate-binding protein
MLMLFATEEGTRRARYGEKGTNWTEIDAGSAESPYGFPATFQLIEDPHNKQNTVRWGSQPGIINLYAEGEDAALDGMTDWAKYKTKLHGEIEQYYVKAEENNNPKVICPTLKYTTEENEKIEMTRTNVNNCWTSAQTEFCTGKRNPNSDADWNAYLKELNDLGQKECMDLAQVVYDRMTKGQS